MAIVASKSREINYQTEEPNNNYVRLIYTGMKHFEKEDEMFMGDEETSFIYPPKAPENYEYKYMTVDVETEYEVKYEGFEFQIYYDEYVDTDGSASYTIKASTYPLFKHYDIYYSCYYSKEDIIHIQDNTIELEIYPPPSPTEFDYWNLFILLDSYAPLRPAKIIDPNGIDLMKNSTKLILSGITLTPRSIKFNPMLSPYYDNYLPEFSFGLYTIHFEKDEDQPFTGLLLETETYKFIKELPPGEEISFKIPLSKGWQFYAGILNLTKLYVRYSNGNWIEVDLSNIFMLGTYIASWESRLECLGIHFSSDFFQFFTEDVLYGWMRYSKQLISYHDEISIKNDGPWWYKIELGVQPLFFKEIVVWDDKGVLIEANQNSFEEAKRGYVFFGGLPDPKWLSDPYIKEARGYYTGFSIGYIPDSIMYTNHPLFEIQNFYAPDGFDASRYLGGSKRSTKIGERLVSSTSNQAFLQVYDYNYGSDFGTYRIFLDWTPIEFMVKDTEGYAVKVATVQILSPSGLILSEGQTDTYGSVNLLAFHPGPYFIRVLKDFSIIYEDSLSVASLRLKKRVNLIVQELAKLSVSPLAYSPIATNLPFSSEDEAHRYIVNAIDQGHPTKANFGTATFEIEVMNKGVIEAKDVILSIIIDLEAEYFSDTDYSKPLTPINEQHLIPYTILNIEPYTIDPINLGDMEPGETLKKKIEVPIYYASVSIERNHPLTQEFTPAIRTMITGWIKVEASAVNAYSQTQHRMLNGFDMRFITGVPADALLKLFQDLFKEIFLNAFIMDLSSPAHLHLYDAQNNHVGFNPDGTVDYDIPNVFIAEIEPGRELMIALEPEEEYMLKVEGTHDGTFDLNILSCKDATIWSLKNIEESPNFVGKIELKELLLNDKIQIDIEGDGTFEETLFARTSKVPEKIPTRITCSVEPDTVSKGNSIIVSGTISPTIIDVSITLTYLIPDGSKLTRTVKTDSNGLFSDSYSPKETGLWSVKASWEGNSNYEGTISKDFMFTVEKAPSFVIPGFPYTIIIFVLFIIIFIFLMLSRRK